MASLLRENTSTYCILHLPLGVTNEGFEAHQGVFSGAVAGDSTLQDRGVACYLLPLLFSLVSLPFIFALVPFIENHKNSYLVL